MAENYHLTASGIASADLATGQLKVGAGAIYQSLSIPGNSQRSDFSVGTAAQAVFSDVLTVTGSIPNPVTVRLSMSVSGIIQADGLGDATPNDRNSTIADFELLGGNANAEVFIGNLQGGALTYADLSRQGGHLNVQSGTADNIQLTLYDDFVVSADNRNIHLKLLRVPVPSAQTVMDQSYRILSIRQI